VPIQDLAVRKQLKVLALVVVNERDPVHPAVLGETLASAIPGAALCRVASKAHPRADTKPASSRQSPNSFDL
jgi:hypothetical protein